MTTLHEAQVDYINRWNKNALQHFKDEDYDWVASLVEKSNAKSVLEIGCGVGYSTLALANKGIKVRAIDSIPEAIEVTKGLLDQYLFSVSVSEMEEKPNILLNQKDLIEDFQEVSSNISSIDTILLCNPGGKLETDLTPKEIEMLKWGKYSDEQMAEENVLVLHKWALLLASSRLAKENGKRLIVVERGTIDELKSVLSIIEIVSGMCGVRNAIRPIKNPPSDGIQLGESGSDLLWGAGLYEP